MDLGENIFQPGILQTGILIRRSIYVQKKTWNAKANYFKDCFTTDSDNLKAFWNIINLTNFSSKKPNFLGINNEIVNYSFKITEAFNQDFIKCSPTSDFSDLSSNCNISNFLCENSLSFSLFSPIDVQQVLNSLSSNSAGPNGLEIKFLKMAIPHNPGNGPEISHHIKIGINFILITIQLSQLLIALWK